MGKLIIKAEVDVDKIQADARAYLRPITLPLRVILIMILRRVLPRTPRPKKTVYTAKNADFVVQNTAEYLAKGEGIGADIDDTPSTESYTQCANPVCGRMFPYQKMGNQIKKYCSSKCKDDVNNAKKKAHVQFWN